MSSWRDDPLRVHLDRTDGVSVKVRSAGDAQPRVRYHHIRWKAPKGSDLRSGKAMQDLVRRLKGGDADGQ